MEVLFATSLFVASHIVLARNGLKRRLVGVFGRKIYLAAYSTVSVIFLGWIVVALERSDRVYLWSAPFWAHYFALGVTALAFALIGAGVASHNPISVSFKSDQKDPSAPSIAGIVRHPIILGFTLWGLAHMPANGDWPSLFLFGGSVAFGGIGMWRLDKRYQSRLGMVKWLKLARRTPGLSGSETMGLIFGLIAWIAALAMHERIIGVDPLVGLV